MDDPTIGGHPQVELPGPDGSVFITVCASCGRVRTILFLEGDRWYCTACRSSGSARPTVIPVSRPGRRGG